MTIDKKVEELVKLFHPVLDRDAHGLFEQKIEEALREHGENEYQRGLVEGAIYSRKVEEEDYKTKKL